MLISGSTQSVATKSPPLESDWTLAHYALTDRVALTVTVNGARTGREHVSVIKNTGTTALAAGTSSDREFSDGLGITRQSAGRRRHAIWVGNRRSGRSGGERYDKCQERGYRRSSRCNLQRGRDLFGAQPTAGRIRSHCDRDRVSDFDGKRHHAHCRRATVFEFGHEGRRTQPNSGSECRDSRYSNDLVNGELHSGFDDDARTASERARLDFAGDVGAGSVEYSEPGGYRIQRQQRKPWIWKSAEQRRASRERKYLPGERDQHQ